MSMYFSNQIQGYKKIIWAIFIISVFACEFIGVTLGVENFKITQQVFVSIPAIGILTYIMTQKMGRHIPNMILLIFQKDKLKKFKQIFDNLDETIIIINIKEDSIKYVNFNFYQ